ncbi:hypothetical protein CC80DRAFT_554129 [Byssothecium circinans]|uniref:Uncharacterized protein n=1 Tax=Byssothecium circinans TaxID=147558 RepID=A0A6A5TCS5_9PLEO|nr:hypothetical protein CC80DRAFT_554129 [Byssothecium circinans]
MQMEEAGEGKREEDRKQEMRECLVKFWTLLLEAVEPFFAFQNLEDPTEARRKDDLLKLNHGFATAKEHKVWEQHIEKGLLSLKKQARPRGAHTILEDDLSRQAVRLCTWEEFIVDMPMYKNDKDFGGRYRRQHRSYMRAITSEASDIKPPYCD